MKENDYPGHYKAFVKELSQKPGQTLQNYCQENGVVWRRLYDWMRRNHISLRWLYQTYRVKSEVSAFAADGSAGIEFMEIVPGCGGIGRAGVSGDAVTGVRVSLPSGITVSLGECNVQALARLINCIAGKGVPDVLAR